MARILIVDDEPDLVRLLEYNLKQAGFETETASTGELALATARARKPDAIILDLMLPDLPGTEICRQLRRDDRLRATPILMLTAKSEEVDRVVGFELGADDYVTKPFDPLVLRARLRNALRRAAPAREAPKHVQVRFDGCTCDPLARTVTHAEGRNAQLTEKEVQLFMALARRAEEVVDRDELSRLLTGGEWSPLNRALDVHVSNLRRKVEAQGAARVVATVRGIGYRADPPA